MLANPGIKIALIEIVASLKTGLLDGFKQFVSRGNVIDLAIAVVIGAAFGSVVSAFVRDILTPLIAAVGGQPDFSALSFTINGSRFMYGDFINSVISFLIVSAVVYYLIVLPLGILNKDRAEKSAISMRKCPECLSDVPTNANRCAFCTSQLSPPPSVLKTGT